MDKLGPYLLGPNSDNQGIYQGDNCHLITELPSESIDLIITSPPYDNLRDYEGYTFDFDLLATGLKRVLKPGGVIVWVVADKTDNGSESGTSFYQALFFRNTLELNLHDTMIYEHTGTPYPEQTRYYQVVEFMFVFSKGKPKTINLIKDRKNKWRGSWSKGTKRTLRSQDGKLKKLKPYWNQDGYGVRNNIWRYASGKGFSTKDEIAHEHPAIFPEKLARDHVISWSNPGDIVFDPMVGSGTVCKMAIQEGRKALGFDCSEKYCNISRERIKGALQPLPINWDAT